MGTSQEKNSQDKTVLLEITYSTSKKESAERFDMTASFFNGPDLKWTGRPR